MADNPFWGLDKAQHFINSYTVKSVELTGFEPVTPSLRTRCSARLSYSPLREWNCTDGGSEGQIGVSLSA